MFKWLPMFLLVLVCAPLASAYEVSEVKDGGAVAGRVYFEADYPKSEQKKVSRDNDTCGLRIPAEEFVVDPETKGLTNVILMIEGIAQGKPFPKEDHVIEQIKCRYSPHVLVVKSGEALKVMNKDPLLHNIHAYLGRETLFNLAQYKNAPAIHRKLEKEGVVRVACDVHDWMEAYVLVLGSPYYAITDPQGKFTISDVPPGEYSIKMWHEVLGETSKKVVVTSQKSSEVNFSIGQ